MAEHPDETSPGLAFFLAQGAGEVSQDDEGQTPARHADGTAPNLPAPCADRVVSLDGPGSMARECLGEPELVGGLAHRIGIGNPDEVFAGTVHETQQSLLVEYEDGDVDGVEDVLQQPRCFRRIEALVAQQRLQLVDLVEGKGQGVVCAGSGSAHRVVALSQGGEDVRHGAQRTV